MIEARFRRQTCGRIRSVEVVGHDTTAGAGRNLVCAAVTAMTDMTALGLMDVMSIPLVLAVDKGRWAIALPEGAVADERAQALLETLMKALIRLGEAQGGAIRVKE